MHDIIVVQNQFGIRAINRFESPFGGLERLFEALNGYGVGSFLRDRIAYSLTADDYICVDGKWFSCDKFGWTQIPYRPEVAAVVAEIVGQ